MLERMTGGENGRRQEDCVRKQEDSVRKQEDSVRKQAEVVKRQAEGVVIQDSFGGYNKDLFCVPR